MFPTIILSTIKSCTDLLEVARCGVVAVLEAGLVEAPLEQVVLPDAVISLAVVVEPRLPCLEEAASRFRASRDLPPPVNCRPARRGVATPTLTEAGVAVTAFLAGALEGRSSAPEVPPLVCAARISGAISAMSGSEFGAETDAARRLAGSRVAPSGSRR